jgi:hypothetical protein
MLKIEIETGNAAFAYFPAGEVDSILAEAFFRPGGSGILRDSNGNRVGQWSWTMDIGELG